MTIRGGFLAGLGLATAAVLLTGVCSAETIAAEEPTPLLLSVPDAPVPFHGSDGRVHLVYELAVTNFSSAEILVERVEVLGDGVVLQSLDQKAVSSRLQPAGTRGSTGTMAKSTQGLVFLNVALKLGAAIPKQLAHRVTIHAEAAPAGQQERTETGGKVEVDRRKVMVIGPPLRGEHYISADSCCDATRHTRAALPVNGRVWIAQRYAVDWEQLDASGRIYSGASEELKNYTIFGQQVLAVADAVVSSITDNFPEQTPGTYPAGISFAQADGNSVVLDLGQGNYALYAHMQPGSLRVKRGDQVKRGQLLGLVGNTGNSVAPHLHFQLMDGPSSLSSNGLPYEIDEFRLTGKTPGTEAFDQAEGKGTPLPIEAISPPRAVREAMPLDQMIVSFAGPH